MLIICRYKQYFNNVPLFIITNDYISFLYPFRKRHAICKLKSIHHLQLPTKNGLSGTTNVGSLRVKRHSETSLELCLDSLLGDGHEISL